MDVILKFQIVLVFLDLVHHCPDIVIFERANSKLLFFFKIQHEVATVLRKLHYDILNVFQTYFFNYGQLSALLVNKPQAQEVVFTYHFIVAIARLVHQPTTYPTSVLALLSLAHLSLPGLFLTNLEGINFHIDVILEMVW